MPTLSEAVAIAGIGGTVRRNGRSAHTVLAGERLVPADDNSLPPLAFSIYLQDGWEVVTSAGPIPDGTRVSFTPPWGTLSGATTGVVRSSYRDDPSQEFTYSIATEDRGHSVTASRSPANPGETVTVLREAPEVPPIFPTDVHRDVAIAAAGIGGEIMHNTMHIRHRVTRDERGWLLSGDPASEYVSTHWDVTVIGDQPEVEVVEPLAPWEQELLASADEHGVEPVPETEPIAVERVARIPRTSAEALILRSQVTSALALFPVIGDDVARMLPALDTLARWLDGGKLQIAGHELAHGENMCGEYESLVCPVFGWTPRRGEESSMMSQRQRFHDGLKAFEQQNAGLPAVDLLERWADMYAPGGPMNTAAVSHITDHLEEHKIPAVNELFDEFGWDNAPEEPVEHCYMIPVEIERERTITERQTVYVHYTATDADSAASMVGRYDAFSQADDSEWQEVDETTDDGDYTVMDDDVEACG